LGVGGSGQSLWVAAAPSTATNSSRSRRAFTAAADSPLPAISSSGPAKPPRRSRASTTRPACAGDRPNRSTRTRGGHLVDIDQAALIELARQLWVADAQLAGQRDITDRDRPGALALCSGGGRDGGHRLR
jgi:hypothetical protein